MTGKRIKKAQEPTLSDVLAATQTTDKRLTMAIQRLDNRLTTAIQALDDRLTTEIHDVLEIMGSRFLIVDKKLIAIHDRVENLGEQIDEVKKRVGTVERIMLEVQDELDDSLETRNSDAETIVAHETRITRLEAAAR